MLIVTCVSLVEVNLVLGKTHPRKKASGACSAENSEVFRQKYAARLHLNQPPKL